MYPNLRAEMARFNVTSVDLSEALGISKDAISNKLIGRTDFRRGEIFTIRDKFFPELTLEYLFRVDEIA